MKSIDQLAEEISVLSAHIQAATCQWLLLVAEFDRREGWGHWGFKTAAHFLSWRCSISPGAAREHVRVARRLSQLPAVTAAFSRGELSYSKVRALTRIEGVEREEELLELARVATASELDRMVRAYRGVVAVEAGAERARERRFADWDFDDDGALVLRARLPAEEGAILLAALRSAVDEVTQERRDACPSASTRDGDASAVEPRPEERDPRASRRSRRRTLCFGLPTARLPATACVRTAIAIKSSCTSTRRRWRDPTAGRSACSMPARPYRRKPPGACAVTAPSCGSRNATAARCRSGASAARSRRRYGVRCTGATVAAGSQAVPSGIGSTPTTSAIG